MSDSNETTSKMLTRRLLEKAIRALMRDIKNTPDREARFEKLEKLAILSEVFESVSNFEHNLFSELDVE